MKEPHIPVLLDEIRSCFSKIERGTIVDCTVGYGGHSEMLLRENRDLKLICFDRDIEALEFSKSRLSCFGNRVEFYHGKFSNSIKKLKNLKDIRGVLADIGLSSLQLDKDSRGFGFNSSRLDMRMDQTQILSAYDVVNSYTVERLEYILREYGEIREYKKVARLITKRVEERPFKSSFELAEFLSKNLYKKKRIHPATLVFQAIRIEVNDELGELKSLLEAIRELKIDKCLVAIISFHSLEDRLIKSYFREWSRECICPKEFMKCLCGGDNSFGDVITKKPIIPTQREIDENPRSRSSKLRLFRVK